MSRGWVVGTEDFTAGLKKQRARGAESSERLELLGGGPGARPQLREETWEAALHALAKRQRVNLAALPAQKSASEKVRVAAAMKATTSVSNGWLAQRLDMGEPASVSQYVRRWRMAEGKRDNAQTVPSAN